MCERGEGTSRDLRIKSVLRGEKIAVTVNGNWLDAYLGETVHAALSAAGIRSLRQANPGPSRGVFCGMGICYECLVTINGTPDQRACMTPVENGMEIGTDEG